MVSLSFAASILVAFVALSQVVVASPSYPAPCEEIHPKNGVSRTYLEPYFTPGKTSNINRKLWSSDDGTVVKVKHFFQVDGDILLINTKDAQAKRIELGFRGDNNEEYKRYFRIKKNHKCFVPTNTNQDAMSINAISYYKKN